MKVGVDLLKKMKSGDTVRVIGRKQLPDGQMHCAPRALRITVLTVAVLASLSLLVGLGVSWHLGQRVNWSGVVVPILPLCVLLGAGSYGARFLRWHVLARQLAAKLTLTRSVTIYVAGYALGLTPGGLGELLKLSFLEQSEGVPALESVAVVSLERTTEGASFLLVAIAGALLARTALSRVSFTAFAPLLALPVFALLPVIARIWQQRHHHSASPGRLVTRIEMAFQGLALVARVRPLLLSVLLALAARSAEGALFWVVLRALGSPVPVAGAMFAVGLAGLTGGMSLLPAGVGAVEMTLTTAAVGFGAHPAMALAAALISRSMTLWLWIPGGLWSAIRHSALHAEQVAPRALPGAPVLAPAPQLRWLVGQVQPAAAVEYATSTPDFAPVPPATDRA
ncbi:MAG: flippase-like domain-containing protein [Chloroflexi bacterium]|nr:flippase-like domain-containing protein [Chloroflexota bacterium]